jgi:hypothetical protein
VSGAGGQELRKQFPLRLIIGSEDLTFLLDSSFTFSNVDPGGFEAASFSVPRDLPQTIRGLPVRIDTGLRVAWEGRVSQIQRSLGNRTQITCEGYAAELKDQFASMIFVDRDLTKWQAATIRRQKFWIENNHAISSPSVVANPNGTPSITEAFNGPWEATSLPIVEGWYNGQGNAIGSLYVAWEKGPIPAGGANWTWLCDVASDDAANGAEGTGNLSSIAGGTSVVTPVAGKPWAVLQFAFGLAGGETNREYTIYWQNVAVYGRHGLTKRGTEPGGFYPSDIAGWVETQAEGVSRGVIPEVTSYIVPHYVQLAPVSLDTILNDMAIQGIAHWGVWEPLSPLTGPGQPRLDFRPRPKLGEYTAFCARRDCDVLDVREDLANLYDKAVVTYTTVEGVSGFAEAKIDNPLLDQAGIHRTAELSGGTMTPAAAETFAKQALELLYAQARIAGSIQISTTIDGPSGPTAPWLLKSGIDRLRIGDLPSTDAFGQYNDLPITRVECSGSESGLTTSIEVGQGAYLLEALQARLAAAATLAAQGG